MKIKIQNFKKIESAEIELDPVNIFIGTNNSGKSSFIQGIQFAVSSCQTLELKNASWRAKFDSRTLALDSSDFLYIPTKNIAHLYHGQRLTGSRNREEKKKIIFRFVNENHNTTIEISKGKNGGFTTTMRGKDLGKNLSEISRPYCVYVPGIAGIPIEERFEVPITIKKSATRGDSNNYLRNIIFSISKDQEKFTKFHNSVNKIYPEVKVEAYFNEDISEFIDVIVDFDGMKLPIDSIGTGLLQAIQIFAYLEYFNPLIFLLDEPDSHIHPTKQILLATEIANRAQNESGPKVVFSTHSRYILEALEGQAKVIHFQDGQSYPDVKGSRILIDIGAADADYLFNKKDLKYIIVTEDKVDNIEEKKKFRNYSGFSGKIFRSG